MEFNQEEVLTEEEYAYFLKEIELGKARPVGETKEVSIRTENIRCVEVEDIHKYNYVCSICGKDFKKIINSKNKKNKIKVCHKCGMSTTKIQDKIGLYKFCGEL